MRNWSDFARARCLQTPFIAPCQRCRGNAPGSRVIIRTSTSQRTAPSRVSHQQSPAQLACLEKISKRLSRDVVTRSHCREFSAQIGRGWVETCPHPSESRAMALTVSWCVSGLRIRLVLGGLSSFVRFSFRRVQDSRKLHDFRDPSNLAVRSGPEVVMCDGRIALQTC